MLSNSFLNTSIIYFIIFSSCLNYFFNSMFIYFILILFFVLYFFDSTEVLEDSSLSHMEVLENQKSELYLLEIMHLLSYIKGIQLIHSKIEVYLFFKKTFRLYFKLLIEVSNLINKLHLNVVTISFFLFYVYPVLPYHTISKHHYIFTNLSWETKIKFLKETDFESEWLISDRCYRLDRDQFETSDLSAIKLSHLDEEFEAFMALLDSIYDDSKNNPYPVDYYNDAWIGIDENEEYVAIIQDFDDRD